MARGELRIHVGAAPGVGGTYAVLSEAHRRGSAARTVGLPSWSITIGRTEVMLHGLEQVPRRELAYRGSTEMEGAVVLDRRRLQHEAEQARTPAEGNRIRAALPAAVSHDLRTPLAGIKVSVSSLRSDDVKWSDGGARMPGSLSPVGGRAPPCGGLHSPARAVRGTQGP